MITITEALAEMKTLSARIEKKQQGLLQYLVRPSQLRDPLEKQEGSVEFVKRERQAIKDLQTRMLLIRTEIQKANLFTTVEVEGETKSVQEWLNWRREVAPLWERHLNGIVATIGTARMGRGRGQSQPQAVPEDLVVNLDEKALHAEIEQHAKIMGSLDGKLSLINATTTINV